MGFSALIKRWQSGDVEEMFGYIFYIKNKERVYFKIIYKFKNH